MVGGKATAQAKTQQEKIQTCKSPPLGLQKIFFQLPLQLCSYCCELLELLEYGVGRVGGVGGVPLDIGSQAGTLSTDVILGCLI